MANELDAFLTEFLPKSVRLRKTPNNEIHKLHQIVDLVYLKFSKQRISLEELKDALEKAGYEQETSNLGTDKGMDLPIIKKVLGSKQGWSFNTHFFADATALKELKRVVKELPNNTREMKLDDNKDLSARLRSFFE